MDVIIRVFYVHLMIIVGLSVLAESLLEYRHFKLGYKTVIYGQQSKVGQKSKLVSTKSSITSPLTDTSKAEDVDTYGPTENFPFRSKLISTQKNGAIRLWVASASHAEGGSLPAKDLFPNLICQYVHATSHLEVINGSKAGMTIARNVSMLKEYILSYKPDYAILYQMSMTISEQQRRLTQCAGTASNVINAYLTRLVKFFQSLSIYIHLSDYIGGNIKLAGQLKDGLPSDMDEDFHKQIMLFIETCRQNNVTPILTTFAGSHDRGNIHQMHFSIRTNFVKYDNYLSPEGWVNTVSRYNNLLRRIASQENVDFIDLEKEMNGKAEYFIDYVHFNKHGHKKVASIIGKWMNRIIIMD
jgi:lysophospholipase L1-like esterase